MDDITLKIFTSGITLESLVGIISLLVSVFFGMAIRKWIQRVIALRTFKNSIYIGIGTYIRIPTSTGHIDGEIIKVSSKRIVIETDVSYIYVPTVDFTDKSWQILKHSEIFSSK